MIQATKRHLNKLATAGAVVLARAGATYAQIDEGVTTATPAGSNQDLTALIRSVINGLLFVVGIASVIMLIVGGIRYVVSAGDQNAVTGAKNTILYAIVGIVISFLAFALVNFVVTRLGGDTGDDAGLGAMLLQHLA